MPRIYQHAPFEKDGILWKRCPRCHETKTIEEGFYVSRTGQRNSYCKECDKKRVNVYRNKNLDVCKLRVNRYYKTHKKAILERIRRFWKSPRGKVKAIEINIRRRTAPHLVRYYKEYNRNPEVRKRINKRHRWRRKIDPLFRIKTGLRRVVGDV